MQQPRRILQQRDPPPAVLDQSVISLQNVGNLPLLLYWVNPNWKLREVLEWDSVNRCARNDIPLNHRTPFRREEVIKHVAWIGEFRVQPNKAHPPSETPSKFARY